MPNWTREETLLALNLYFATPFGKQHSRHRPIVELANAIGRSPGAVAMKLNNFTSLDPVERERGIVGLANASRLDRQIWDEFQDNQEELAVEIELLVDGRELALDDQEAERSLPATESTAARRVRLQQSFFRRIVTQSYDSTCCITGNPVRELLRASHIVPWSVSREHRLNPRNGLCLAATFDAAFDRGLIAIDDEYRLLIGTKLKRHATNERIRQEFMNREGDRIRLPDKNLPEVQFLRWHRENIAGLA